MIELQTIRRVTVYADAALESFIIQHALAVGARGYSAAECRGKGKHEILADPRTGASVVRIEFLVRPEVGEKIMYYLSSPEFRRRAVAACMESVQVPAGEEF